MPTNEVSYAPSNRLLTIPETAETLRLSRSTIYQLIRNKHLEIVKIGRSTRIPAKAVDEAVERLRGANGLRA